MNKLIIASGSNIISATQLARMLIGVDAAVITKDSATVHQTKLVSDFAGFETEPFPMYPTSGKQKAQWKQERKQYKRK